MRRSLILALVIALAIPVSTTTPAYAANPTLNFFVSPPTVQNTNVTGARIATFNDKTAGQACPTQWLTDPTTDEPNGIPIGTITTNGCKIRVQDKFGGAVLGATAAQFPASGTFSPVDGTNYVGIPSGKTVTLSLTRSESYLGFWWSAGDANNKITLFSGGPSGTQVGVFTTATLNGLLGGSSPSNTKQITAIDGKKYNGCLYYGNPRLVDRRTSCSETSSTYNFNQPYAYIHLIGEGGLEFDTIVFSQGSSGGFEFDNMAIARNVVSPSVVTEFPEEINSGSPDQVANTCEAFSTTFAITASNFTTAPTYSIDPTTLPEGLTFNPATGGVSGTPTAGFTKTTYTLTASAGDQTATTTVSLEVNDLGNTPCPPPPDPPANQSSHTRTSNPHGHLQDTPNGPQLAATGAPAWPVWAGVTIASGLALYGWARFTSRQPVRARND